MTTITDNNDTCDLDQAVAYVTAFGSWSELHHSMTARGYTPTLRTDVPDVGDAAHWNEQVRKITDAIDACGLSHFPSGM